VLMGGTLRNFCTCVLLWGARGWSAPTVVCGCGQARCWVVGEQAHTPLGVWLLSLSTAMDHGPCVGGGGLGVWWLFVL